MDFNWYVNSLIDIVKNLKGIIKKKIERNKKVLKD